MSNYKKFSLDTIKQKLKNGDYAEAVGAMRAIGKTQELSEGDKEKARVLVRKHFGIENPPAKGKKAAKKVTAKAAKKAKAAAKPKAARGKKAAKPAAAAAPAKKAAKKASKKGRRSKPAAAAPEGDTEVSEAEVGAIEAAAAPKSTQNGAKSKASPEPGVLVTMGQVISTVGESLRAMELAKRLVPKASLERDVGVATGAMARAVQIIDQEIMRPRLSDGAPEAAATPRKKAAKKGTRAKATTPAQPEEQASTNGAHDEENLTAEEQEQLRLARTTQPTVES